MDNYTDSVHTCVFLYVGLHGHVRLVVTIFNRQHGVFIFRRENESVEENMVAFFCNITKYTVVMAPNRENVGTTALGNKSIINL